MHAWVGGVVGKYWDASLCFVLFSADGDFRREFLVLSSLLVLSISVFFLPLSSAAFGKTGSTYPFSPLLVFYVFGGCFSFRLFPLFFLAAFACQILGGPQNEHENSVFSVSA